MKPRLIFAFTVPEAVKVRAREQFDAVVADGRDMTMEEAVARAAEHRAGAIVITSSQRLSAEIIASLPPEVKIVATCSVGFDHIDVPAAKARGLIVTNTPDVVTVATADLTFLLILNACRRAYEYDRLMREGWGRRLGQDELLGIEVTGKTLGIVGMGRIGRAVAKRARGFDMKIRYTNRNRLPPELEEDAVYHPDLKSMLPHCQILTLHAPGNKDTDKMINREMLSLLPRGAVLVNASRGVLVDEDALIEALTSGQLAAAGLDVFRSEPGYDQRLGALSNVFLTPHMGSATVETRNAMGYRALDNTAAVLAGGAPIDPLWS